MRTWLLVALLACGGKKDDAPPPAPPPKPAAVVPAGSVQVFVNDAPAVVLDATKIATWPRLDGLVPTEVRKIGTWQAVQTVGETTESLDKPSDNYRDMVPAVYPGPGGAPAFGMFDPVELAKHGTPAVHRDKLREIRLKVAAADGRGGNEDSASSNADPTKIVIEIKTPSGASRLTGDKLLAIAREPAPGGNGQGWKLVTLLDAAGIKSFEKLVLGDTQGTVLPIEKADISETSIPFVKLNKQGQLRVKVWKKQGDGFTAAGELRSMTSITQLK